MWPMMEACEPEGRGEGEGRPRWGLLALTILPWAEALPVPRIREQTSRVDKPEGSSYNDGVGLPHIFND